MRTIHFEEVMTPTKTTVIQMRKEIKAGSERTEVERKTFWGVNC